MLTLPVSSVLHKCCMGKSLVAVTGQPEGAPGFEILARLLWFVFRALGLESFLGKLLSEMIYGSGCFFLLAGEDAIKSQKHYHLLGVNYLQIKTTMRQCLYAI